MRALVTRAPGGPETLTLGELPKPVPQPTEVRIAVRCCAVNYPDVLIIQDLYQFRPDRPFAPGGEVSGVVDAVGDSVSTLRIGDRVIASCGWGGMAEYVAIDAAQCFNISDRLPFDEGAALLLTFATAYYALKDRGRLAPGSTLLVLGAAGGVGLAAVEVGRAMGARVIAAASSQAKTALAREHGAESSLVYPRGPFDKHGARALADQFKAACGANGADVILDAVGGDYTEAALRAIAWNGRLLVVGFPAGIPRVPLNLALLKSCDIVGVFWGSATKRDPAAHAENVATLIDWWSTGTIRPVITERYPLAHAEKAIQRLQSREATGKIIINVAD
jgi:NADPH2:quinone reductase